MRVLKIIAAFGGPRRVRNNNNVTPEDSLEFLKLQIANEHNTDPGCKLDVLVVNNDAGIEDYNTYIQSIDNLPAHSGKIRTYTRENLGGSFGAFSQGYDYLGKDYDYVLFCEDDILIYESEYMKPILELFETDSTVGFVPLSPLSHTHPVHCGGGFGVGSRSVLQQVCKKFGRLPFVAQNSYDAFEQSEIGFTSCITELGYSLTPVQAYSSLAENYIKHTSQNMPHFVTEVNLSKKFIYKVGN